MKRTIRLALAGLVAAVLAVVMLQAAPPQALVQAFSPNPQKTSAPPAPVASIHDTPVAAPGQASEVNSRGGI